MFLFLRKIYVKKNLEDMGFFDDISKESLHEAEAAGLLGASTGQVRAADSIWSQAASVCWIQAGSRPGLELGLLLAPGACEDDNKCLSAAWN